LLGPKKARRLDRPVTVSLESLVPPNHFYRHLERSLDLSFVRDLVADSYKAGGRPSIDPVVFFKLQLILFFEGLRSERKLIETASLHLAHRWYLGYSLDERLPDHSSLTRMRQRFGRTVSEQFFDTILEQCRAAGLIWGAELYVDATQVEANASMDSGVPRFAVEAHLGRLFSGEPADDPPADDGDLPPGPGSSAPPTPLPTPLADEQRAELAEHNAVRHDWLARGGQPDRTIIRAGYRRRADYEASTTDPDAAPVARKAGNLGYGYQAPYLVDGGKARIILQALATPGDVMENLPFLDLVWRARSRWRIQPRQLCGDTTYGAAACVAALEHQGIKAYVPLPDHEKRSPLYGASKFTYEPEQDQYRCPAGQVLRRGRVDEPNQAVQYRARAATCRACELKAKCTTSPSGRGLNRSFFAEALDRVRGYHETAAFQRAMNKRRVWVEPLFGEGKAWHGLRRFRLRRLWKVSTELFLIAAGQNLKRLLKRRGWGRRPWPNGAPESPQALGMPAFSLAFAAVPIA
jgi:transposase